MRKIALIGTGASAKDAPYDDKTYEIWGVASRFPYVTRANRWFELHRLEGENKDFKANWRKSVNKFIGDLPLYMFYPEHGLGPGVAAYPYEHIVERFGTYFMTSSFSWMLAMAIDELRPENGEPVQGEIATYGVDMEYGTEYRQQRAGFRHFIDLARVLGIRVSRFLDSGLSFEPVPYPMWQDDPLIAKLETRKKENTEKLDEEEELLRHTRTMIAQNQMVLDELIRHTKECSSDYVDERIQVYERQLKNLLQTSAKISSQIVHYNAISMEQSWFRDYLDH